ncbi:hypothetical protein [Actinomycetospora chiangmaiensis]|uniref:hypothetical protein n=1 Tax=Actinomycetospora chiangmaiensis TaxID=402650 RepID=UPI00036E423C|nr:hypothetical protein [Actinomycetospora chiangmaiensis]
MIDSDDPTDRDDTPADPPHPESGEAADPAFDIDLEPEDQGTAGAAAEPSG